jgi:hypothetical protein
LHIFNNQLTTFKTFTGQTQAQTKQIIRNQTKIHQPTNQPTYKQTNLHQINQAAKHQIMSQSYTQAQTKTITTKQPINTRTNQSTKGHQTNQGVKHKIISQQLLSISNQLTKQRSMYQTICTTYQPTTNKQQFNKHKKANNYKSTKNT